MSSLRNNDNNPRTRTPYHDHRRQYSPQQSFSNRTRQNNFFHQQHSYVVKSSNTQEKVSFSISNENIKGPTISLQVISKSMSPSEIQPFISQLHTIRANNNWNDQQSFMSLKIVLNDDLRTIVNGCENCASAIERLLDLFFPETDFFYHKNLMRKLQSRNFHIVSDYLNELRRLEKLANNTMRLAKPLLEREVLQLFLNGLSPTLRHSASLIGILDLEQLAKRLDNSIFISSNLRYKTTTIIG